MNNEEIAPLFEITDDRRRNAEYVAVVLALCSRSIDVIGEALTVQWANDPGMFSLVSVLGDALLRPFGVTAEIVENTRIRAEGPLSQIPEGDEPEGTTEEN